MRPARFALLAALALAACGEVAASPDAGAPAPDSGSTSPDAAALPDAGAPPCAPVLTDPGAGPSGYPLDGWGWRKRGVLLEDAAAAAMDGYIGPALIEWSGQLVLLLTRKQGTQHRIYRSTSTDGLSWTAPEPVTGLGGENVIAYPTALAEGSRLRLWFTAGHLESAESADASAWSVTTPASGGFGPSTGGGFDSLSVLYPSVVRASAGYALYYTGFNGSTFAIGRATSPDGASWVRSADPVLTAGAATEFDNNAVAQSQVLIAGSAHLMWYGGYDTSKTRPGPYRVGLAVSGDGVSWTKRGVSLDLGVAGERDAYSTRDPAVVRWRAGWLMVYAGMGEDYRYRLMSATSEACAP